MNHDNAWALIQEDIKNKNLIFSVKVTNSSYLRIGGYNARPYSLKLGIGERLRPSKIKGILKWWLRVVILGQRNNLPSYKEAEDIINRYYRYLSSDRNEYGQSKFLLNIKYEKIDNEKVDNFRNEIFRMIDDEKYTTKLKELESDEKYAKLKELESIPRIKLILMKRKDEKEYKKEELSLYPPYTVNVIISFYTKTKIKTSEEIEMLKTLFGTLILMLIFQGLSAFSSRGFAGCKLLEIYINSEFQNYLNKIYNIINEKIINADKKEKLEEGIKDLINNIINEKKEKLEEGINKSSRMPEVPTLDASSNYFVFKVFEVKPGHSPEKILKIINESVLKSTWKNFDKRGKPDKYYHTWILGLPRSQRKTGYIVFEKVVENNKEIEKKGFRRKSAIGINIFETKNKKFVILHGFKSNDWPVCKKTQDKKLFILKHFSKKGGEEEITKIMNITDNRKDVANANAVEEAFNQALDYLERYLKSQL